MTEYLCLIRDRHGCYWVTAASSDSQVEAKEYGKSFGELISLIAKRTGICPPVGMRADQTSHWWEPMIVGSVEDAEIIEVLRPRPKTALEIQQEYHSDPDGDLDGYDGA